jgi:hypothetical protein
MIDESREARETARDAGMETAGRDRLRPAPRTSMLFSATGWTFNVRLGRSGREEGEGIMLVGEIGYRTAAGDRRTYPARAMVVKSDARKRLDLVLAPQEAVLTIPLEPFAMQRLQDRLKDLVSGHGMAVRIGFSAEETPERQVLEAVDFAFSSLSRSTPETRATQARDR